MLNSCIVNLTKQKLILIHIVVIPLLIAGSLYAGYLFNEEIGKFLTRQTSEEKPPQETEFYEAYPNTIDSIIFNNIKIDNAFQAGEGGELLQIPIEITLSIKNSTIEEGVRTISLVRCDYLIDDKEILYTGGNTFTALDNLIPINEEDSIIIRDQVFERIECGYDEEGSRTCPSPKELTVKDCVLLYSSEEKNRLQQGLLWMLDGKFPLKVEPNSDSAELLKDESRIIIEEIEMNETLDIEYLPH
jgi:hypothetical protein